MEEVKLREASTDDIPLIADLAHLIWNQHYPDLIGQKQVNYMLSMMYNNEALKKQMLEKMHRFFIVSENGDDLGFVSLHETEKKEWFINKFYIDQRKAAKGIGTKTFEWLCDLLDPKKISLTVNRGNYKTINFYFKLGFRIQRTAVFDIGNGYVMDDFVMEWDKIEK